MAYGGTPLFSNLLREGRILKTMPFNFYFTPHLTLILKNYDALSYFQKIAGLHSLLSSTKVIRMRLAAKTPRLVQAIHLFRTFGGRGLTTTWRDMVNRLQTDSHYRAFHAGETQTLPDFYIGEYKRRLGRYAELMPIQESQPLLDGEPVVPLMPHASPVPMTASVRPKSMGECLVQVLG